MFWRILRAEFLKLRRTAALKLAVLAPSAVVLLVFFIASQAPHTFLKRPGVDNDWIALAHATFLFWGILMLPLYITVQTSLVAGVDHADNQWKSILARPVPRYAFYLGKLAVVSTLTVVSSSLLLIGILATGAVLPHVQSVAAFDRLLPASFLAREGWQMTALVFLALTIQHWISLRWRSFAVSTGAGILAMVIGYGMVVASSPDGGWPAYFPWSLPMLVLARWPVPLGAVLLSSALAGCLVTALGCLEFSTREVK
jgi:lantibiotic transport system permease protein